LLKILLCFFALHAQAHPEESDNADPPKIRRVLSSNIENLTQGAKRAAIAIAFDIPTISRQVTAKPYNQILASLKETPFPKILTVHSIETLLRSQVIYSLYDFITQQARKLAPQLTNEHPIIPQIAVIPFVAASDIIFMNPFERIKVCLLNNREIPFFQQQKIKWAALVTGREWLFTGGTLTFQTSFAHVSTFLILRHLLTPHIIKSEKPKFSEALQLGSIIAATQTAVTFPLLTFRAKLHDQQAELFNIGRGRISTSQFFWKLAKEKRLLTLYFGTLPRLLRGVTLATQDAYTLHNK
jgi:hypothetical protein